MLSSLFLFSFTSLNTRKKNVSCDYTKDAGDTSLELRDVDETREDHEHKVNWLL